MRALIVLACSLWRGSVDAPLGCPLPGCSGPHLKTTPAVSTSCVCTRGRYLSKHTLLRFLSSNWPNREDVSPYR